MILTINLNPVLEKMYYMEKLLPRVETEAEKVVYKSGGAGKNTSQIINSLNVDVLPIGFLGGLSGKYIYNDLTEQRIDSDFTIIKDETQSAIWIIENNKFLSKIVEMKPRITRDELGGFYELYKNIISKCSIICGNGSVPIGTPEEIYFDLITLCNKENKKFLLEAEDIELQYGIEAKPYMVKITVGQLENLTRLKLNFENEIIKAANYILEKDVELVIVDLDVKGSIVLTKERGYRLEVNDIDLSKIGIDQGYTLSGYGYGIEKNYDLDMTMRLGQSFRIAYSIAENIREIDMSDIKKIMSSITIMPIYY